MRQERYNDNNQEKIVNSFALKYFFNKCYNNVEEVVDKRRQCAGIDVIADGKSIDIKAQSSKKYINAPRPTFILELSCLNSQREEMLGWFINPEVVTDVYAFMWINKAYAPRGIIPSIESIDEVEIMLVDKHLLKAYINTTYNDSTLLSVSQHMRQMGESYLPSTIEGIHFSHTPTLFEQPSNIVAKKDFLKKFAIKHSIVTTKEIIDIT